MQDFIFGWTVPFKLATFLAHNLHFGDKYGTLGSKPASENREYLMNIFVPKMNLTRQPRKLFAVFLIALWSCLEGQDSAITGKKEMNINAFIKG